MNTSFGFGGRANGSKISDFDREMSKMFITALKQQRLLDVIPRSDAWADEFRLLRRNHGEEEIRETLTWYCEHHRDEYVPKTLSAAGFRTKFIQIREAMNRGTEDWSTLSDVEITPLAHRISMYLGGLIWPGDEKKDELKAIQVSINNYREFLRQLKQSKERVPRRVGLVDFIIGCYGDVSTVVEAWWDDVHRRSHSPHWTGNLARHVLSCSNERFQFKVNGWCREYCGPGEYWSVIEELLNGQAQRREV